MARTKQTAQRQLEALPRVPQLTPAQSKADRAAQELSSLDVAPFVADFLADHSPIALGKFTLCKIPVQISATLAELNLSLHKECTCTTCGNSHIAQPTKLKRELSIKIERDHEKKRQMPYGYAYFLHEFERCFQPMPLETISLGLFNVPLNPDSVAATLKRIPLLLSKLQFEFRQYNENGQDIGAADPAVAFENACLKNDGGKCVTLMPHFF